MSEKHTQSLHIVMPIEAHKALKELAKKQRRGLADVAREAIENYLTSQGYPVNMGVNRGGYRARDESSKDE